MMIETNEVEESDQLFGSVVHNQRAIHDSIVDADQDYQLSNNHTFAQI